MATVDGLLAALHDRNCELAEQSNSPPDGSLLGWNRVAGTALRILAMVDPPTELMPILEAVLNATERRDAHINAPITAIGYTLGALADTMSSDPELVASASHADRAELRSAVLTSLHNVATATMAATPPGTDPRAVRDLLSDMAAVTEAASYAPWRSIHGPVGQLSLDPAEGTIQRAVVRWANSASEVLDSPTRVTGYTFQRTAASIARLCHTTATTLAAAGEWTQLAREAESSLTIAFQSWKIAANWPPEIRLGGRTTELRQRSADLDQALDAILLRQAAPLRPDAVQTALRFASKVGAHHEAALIRLVNNRGLWILAQALGPVYLTKHPGVHRNDWVPDPGSSLSQNLIHAVHHANWVLQSAAERVDRIQGAARGIYVSDPVRWEELAGTRRPRRDTQEPLLTQARRLGR